jgi:hypothetical protein
MHAPTRLLPNGLSLCLPTALRAQKPATLDEAVEKLVAARLGEERAALAAAYQEREAVLAARVAALEAMLLSGKPPSAAGGGGAAGSKGGR